MFRWQRSSTPAAPSGDESVEPIPSLSPPAAPAEPRRVAFENGGHELVATIWDGEELASPGKRLAFDTETTQIVTNGSKASVPDLVVASASDGKRHVVIFPARLPDFLKLHVDRVFVLHNLSFDYEVIRRALGGGNPFDQIVEEGRVRDTFALAIALEMFETGQEWTQLPVKFSLDALAERYTDFRLEKGATQLEYDTIRDKPLESVEDRFIAYAALDATATLAVHKELTKRSSASLEPFKPEIDLDYVHRFGWFCESIHARAKIVLDRMERQGLRVDVNKIRRLAHAMRGEVVQLSDQLEALMPPAPVLAKAEDTNGDGSAVLISEYVPSISTKADFARQLKADAELLQRCRRELPGKTLVYSNRHERSRAEVIRDELFGLFHRDAAGAIKYNEKGTPSAKEEYVLRPRLAELLKERKASLPETSKGVSIAKELWEPFADDPFVALWLEWKDICKLLDTPDQWDEEWKYTRYNFCVRTGRVSAGKPNAQQLPKGYVRGEPKYQFRECILAPPGQKFIHVDFKTIEIATFAQHCLRKYGYSEYAAKLLAGEDIHSHAAAAAEGVDYTEFLEWKTGRPADYFTKRACGKACNFAILGSAGAPRIKTMVRAQAGVDLSIKEARKFRSATLKTFPELVPHLEFPIHEALAYNLGCDVVKVRALFDKADGWNVEQILRGKDDDYDDESVDDVFYGLQGVCECPELREKLSERRGSEQLYKDLCYYPVTNFAGFARGRCKHSDRSNHPFQSIAALGAKLAAWRVSRKYTVALFTHDELSVLVPADANEELVAKDVSSIMVGAMTEFVTDIPVNTEWFAGNSWAGWTEEDPPFVEVSNDVSESVRSGKEHTSEPITDSGVIHGSCLEVIPRLDRQFAFIFADPPFNIGHGYTGCDDRKAESEFNELISGFVKLCWAALSDSGVLALHGPDDLAKRYLRLEDELLMRRIAWVNWHYRFGQCHRSNWIDARCHCLIYAKGGEWTWNSDEVLVDSDRKATYGDKRIDEIENGGKRLPGTVWGIPSDGPYWGRVQGNSKERRADHPNKLPEVYLARLIKAYTNPGDWVLDPFGGSGTTAAVAKALGRQYVTIDVSEHNVASIRERLERGAVRVK